MTEFREGHTGGDAHTCSADAEVREGAKDHASPIVRPPPLAHIIANLREKLTERRFCIDQQKRIDNSTGAYVRRALGWSWEMPEKERARLNKEAAALIDQIERTGEGGGPLAAVVFVAKVSRSSFDQLRAAAEKDMVKLVKALPVYPWAEAVRGFGAMSLACIVGEAGDLGEYAGPAKLWKRMGLAVMGDVRQGGLAKGATAEAWVAHGYSARRRSTMWVIGDCLVKTNRDGEYRTLYLARKEYELQRDPEMKPIKAHRRAQRYMEKRLLRELWRAWREASHDAMPGQEAPPAEPFEDRSPGDGGSGPEAGVDASPTARLPPANLPVVACIPPRTTS